MKNAWCNSRLFSLGQIGRAALTLAVVALGLGVRVEAGIKSQRQLTAIVAQTPAPRLVAEGQQLKQAEQVAASMQGAIAFLGIGESMEPLYAANTAVVVKPIAYDDIKKGMTLVYVKSNGRRVAHSVIGETRGGYLVQGVNNDEADAEVVNEDNLIGVVVAAYATTDTDFRHNFGHRVAAQDSGLAAVRSHT